MSDVRHMLILGSSSRYRQELLQRLKIPFLSVSPDINETPQAGESPLALALRLSKEKALAVATAYPNAIVIGADQVASLRNTPIGKPGSLPAARDQLSLLSGQTVIFHSAITVVYKDSIQTVDTPTTCVFRELSAEAIARYVEIDQPWDTAGAAKAECLGIALMESITSSDPTAIIGLPLITLTSMLRLVGFDPLEQAKIHL